MVIHKDTGCILKSYINFTSDFALFDNNPKFSYSVSERFDSSFFSDVTLLISSSISLLYIIITFLSINRQMIMQDLFIIWYL